MEGEFGENGFTSQKGHRTLAHDFLCPIMMTVCTACESQKKSRVGDSFHFFE